MDETRERPLCIASAGHAALAATFVTLGVVGLVEGALVPVWAPVGKDAPAREILIYLCALVSLGCGLGLVVRRVATISARVLLASLMLWLVAFRISAIIRAPGMFGTWDTCAENLAVTAGALVLASGERGRRVARVAYGVALIPFGVAHFLYLDDTVRLVPHWLPAHEPIAYFTGGAFLAAGTAIVVGVWAPLAAALSAAQMGLFTLLVWVPIVSSGSAPAFAWHELGISAALTAAGWLVADSYSHEVARVQ